MDGNQRISQVSSPWRPDIPHVSGANAGPAKPHKGIRRNQRWKINEVCARNAQDDPGGGEKYLPEGFGKWADLSLQAPRLQGGAEGVWRRGRGRRQECPALPLFAGSRRGTAVGPARWPGSPAESGPPGFEPPRGSHATARGTGPGRPFPAAVSPPAGPPRGPSQPRSPAGRVPASGARRPGGLRRPLPGGGEQDARGSRAAGECLAAPAPRVSDWARRSPPSLAPGPLPGGRSAPRPPGPPLLSHLSWELLAALSAWRAGRAPPPPARTHARGPGFGVLGCYSRRLEGGGSPGHTVGRRRKKPGAEERGGGGGRFATFSPHCERPR
ncbi:PREDICTED: collagen alpha-1(I) chain-like [Hipposideros armiger]|uniref:Collagen alpha-1(I) chain-like n=1 Tax=Hipposideros armiger TaxID=186990 RepID=A0A8B7QRX4_HIPAR|nr:PREDICTED: collagen alpha-1(I) chain-like [Hipposideros armiger]